MNRELIETAMQEIMEEQKESRKLAEHLIGKNRSFISTC